MKIKFILLLSFLFSIGFSQENLPYQLYNKKGKIITFDKMVDELSTYDIVLFGEFHDNSINHWLELRLAKSLFQKKGNQLILAAEMFERDNQIALNNYLSGKLKEEQLKDSLRLWSNFKTDYKPLVDFAKDKKLTFIASNIPRRYASIVAKKGLDSLQTVSTKEKSFMMKLPIEVSLETPGYVEMKEMMGAHAGGDVMNFVAAQAVKDATMAESIAQIYQPGKLLVHYNGDYHSKQYGGIFWYLKKSNPNLKIAVISVFESDLEKLNLPEKDFVPTEFNLVIPADMTKTY